MGFTANTAFVVLAGCAGALLSALLLGASFLLFRRRHKSSRRALWEQAYVDPVTGGPTRLRFERDAEALASAAAPGSYAVVDINLYHFRFMNNLFGRAEGDRILRHIYTTCSARLQPASRSSASSSANMRLPVVFMAHPFSTKSSFWYCNAEIFTDSTKGTP